MIRHYWSEDEVEALKARYPHENSARLAEAIGLRIEQINYKAQALGLKKSPEYLSGAESGRANIVRGASSRFKPGNKPWNTGLKWDAGGRSHETRFKPGVRHGKALKLYQPIGAERVNRDGYLERKINDDMPFNV